MAGQQDKHNLRRRRQYLRPIPPNVEPFYRFDTHEEARAALAGLVEAFDTAIATLPSSEAGWKARLTRARIVLSHQIGEAS